MILLGLAALALAWPVFMFVALLFGHSGMPSRMLIAEVFAAPILMVLVGLAALACTKAGRLPVVAALAGALAFDFALLFWEAVDPTPARRPYLVTAALVDGRLIFSGGQRGEDCVGLISVASPRGRTAMPVPDDNVRMVEARLVWMVEPEIPHRPGRCWTDLPVRYGMTAPRTTELVSPKRLRGGELYSVAVHGGRGPGGTGCFRIMPGPRVENLTERDCRYEPDPPGPAPRAPEEHIVVSARPADASSD